MTKFCYIYSTSNRTLEKKKKTEKTTHLQLRARVQRPFSNAEEVPRAHPGPAPCSFRWLSESRREKKVRECALVHTAAAVVPRPPSKIKQPCSRASEQQRSIVAAECASTYNTCTTTHQPLAATVLSPARASPPEIGSELREYNGLSSLPGA